jgi:hypothetical protein
MPRLRKAETGVFILGQSTRACTLMSEKAYHGQSTVLHVNVRILILERLPDCPTVDCVAVILACNLRTLFCLGLANHNVAVF